MDLSHDGDIEHSGVNNCQNEKYIMTTSLGPGKMNRLQLKKVSIRKFWIEAVSVRTDNGAFAIQSH